jgi:hypothetical protein
LIHHGRAEGCGSRPLGGANSYFAKPVG